MILHRLNFEYKPFLSLAELSSERLLCFVPHSLLPHLLLHDHHVQHLQPGVQALARLGAGQHNPPLLLPSQLPETEIEDVAQIKRCHLRARLVTTCLSLRAIGRSCLLAMIRRGVSFSFSFSKIILNFK